jgi:Fur family peroxide stress response transcriptional regulator
MDLSEIRKKLSEKGLKITPQRIEVLQAIYTLHNHPTADIIIAHIKKLHPNIAIGTVYKTLETFVQKGLITKVKTDSDIMHYDEVMDDHHHLYCSESDKIEDYFDTELDQIIHDYFEKKDIPNFEIEDIKLQIKGKFAIKANKK